jgi:hypothetical protein
MSYTQSFEINGEFHMAQIWDSQGFDDNPGIAFIPLFKTYSAWIIVYAIDE